MNLPLERKSEENENTQRQNDELETNDEQTHKQIKQQKKK